MNTDTITNEASLEAEYETLRAGLLEAHQPQNAHERVLVEEFVDAYWDFKAAHRVDREFWCYVGGHYGPGASGIAEAQFQEKEGRFRTHLRYRADCERSYYRALNALKPLGRNASRALSANAQPSPTGAPEPPRPKPHPAPQGAEPQLRHPGITSRSALDGLQHLSIALLAWIAFHLQQLAPVPAAAVREYLQIVAVGELPHRISGNRVIPFSRPRVARRASAVPRLRDPAVCAA